MKNMARYIWLIGAIALSCSGLIGCSKPNDNAAPPPANAAPNAPAPTQETINTEKDHFGPVKGDGK